MEFRLLGEMELRAAGQMLHVGAPRPQAVLAALAVDAGRPVAIETLIDRVWADAPPVEVRNVLYSYLSRIRRLLKHAATLTGETTVRIERRHAGYVLDVDPDLVDLHRFRRLVSDPQCGDRARATALAEALGLWRGSALAGLPGRWAEQIRDSWDRRRLDAVVQWAQVELRLGHPVAVITTLPDLAAEYPLVEPLEALLMRALHAAGRSAEALDRYTAVRQRLADELGTDPGPELRALHAAVLHGELPAPAVKTAPPATSTSAAGQHGPDPASANGSESSTRLPGHRPFVPDAATVTHEPRLEASSGRIDAVATDRPPGRTRWWPTRRRAVLAALLAVVLLAAIASAPIFHQDKDDSSSSTTLSIERAQALFAIAREFDQEGRVQDARETTAEAVRLYNELISRNPDQNAPLLAPTIIQALDGAGVDFSVTEAQLGSWLANPTYTPYPAISQVLLLQGWQLKEPVYLDVIVWNYVHTPSITSPRNVADVQPDALKAAILEGSVSRHGTQATDFEQLLEQ